MMLAAGANGGTNYALPIAIAIATVLGVVVTNFVNARIRKNDRTHESAEREKDREQALTAVDKTLDDAANARADQANAERSGRLESYRITAIMDLIRMSRSAQTKIESSIYAMHEPDALDWNAMQDCITRVQLLCSEEDTFIAATRAADAVQALYRESIRLALRREQGETVDFSAGLDAGQDLMRNTDAFIAQARVELGIIASR